MKDQDLDTGCTRARSPNPTGARTHYSEHRWARQAAAEIDRIPEDLNLFQALYYLERDDVAEELRCGDCEVKHLRFLLRCAKGKGLLKAGERPIVSLTKSKTRRLRRITAKKLHMLEHKLATLGAIYWKDSSNYRRYQTTDARGEVQAYGVDLTPLVRLIPILKKTAERLQEEDAERKDHERLLSDIRRHTRDELRQILARPGVDRDALEALLDRVLQLPNKPTMERLDLEALRSCRNTAITVQRDARVFVDLVEAGATQTSAKPHDSPDFSAEEGSQGTPAGEATITNTRRESCTCVVAADPETNPSAETPETSAAAPGPGRGDGSNGEASYNPDDFKGPAGEEVLKALSPRIAQYLPPDREPSMTDFVEAASHARRDLKISPTLWSKACRNMSPGGASLALAHVAAKWDDGEIEETPGAYFDGIFKRSMAGELNLGASLWGMVSRHAERTASNASETPARPTSPSELPAAAPKPDTAPEISNDPSLGSSRTVVNPVFMDRFCGGIADPESMRKVWLGLVRKHGRWPYVDELRARYAAIGNAGSRALLPSMFHSYPQVPVVNREPQPTALGSLGLNSAIPAHRKTGMSDHDQPRLSMPATLPDPGPQTSLKGWKYMPPSIRAAHMLVQRVTAMDEAESNALTSPEVEAYLAAFAVTRMPQPLAQCMPPVGVLGWDTLVAATKRALPEFRVSPRAWKACCRRHDERFGVLAMCIVVSKIHEHEGPVPQELPDTLLARISALRKPGRSRQARRLQGCTTMTHPQRGNSNATPILLPPFPVLRDMLSTICLAHYVDEPPRPNTWTELIQAARQLNTDINQPFLSVKHPPSHAWDHVANLIGERGAVAACLFSATLDLLREITVEPQRWFIQAADDAESGGDFTFDKICPDMLAALRRLRHPCPPHAPQHLPSLYAVHSALAFVDPEWSPTSEHGRWVALYRNVRHDLSIDREIPDELWSRLTVWLGRQGAAVAVVIAAARQTIRKSGANACLEIIEELHRSASAGTLFLDQALADLPIPDTYAWSQS